MTYSTPTSTIQSNFTYSSFLKNISQSPTLRSLTQPILSTLRLSSLSLVKSSLCPMWSFLPTPSSNSISLRSFLKSFNSFLSSRQFNSLSNSANSGLFGIPPSAKQFSHSIKCLMKWKKKGNWPFALKDTISPRKAYTFNTSIKS